MYATTLTQKGQVTIPAPIRKKLGLKKGTKVSFREKKGEVIIEPLMTAPALIGSLKSLVLSKFAELKISKSVPVVFNMFLGTGALQNLSLLLTFVFEVRVISSVF